MEVGEGVKRTVGALSLARAVTNPETFNQTAVRSVVSGGYFSNVQLHTGP